MTPRTETQNAQRGTRPPACTAGTRAALPGASKALRTHPIPLLGATGRHSPGHRTARSCGRRGSLDPPPSARRHVTRARGQDPNLARTTPARPRPGERQSGRAFRRAPPPGRPIRARNGRARPRRRPHYWLLRGGGRAGLRPALPGGAPAHLGQRTCGWGCRPGGQGPGARGRGFPGRRRLGAEFCCLYLTFALSYLQVSSVVI